MKHQKGSEPISKDKCRAIQGNGNRRENQTCDGPYEGLAKYGNQAYGCHQYEHLQLSDIRLQDDAIHRGHPSPDSLNTDLTPNVKVFKDTSRSGITTIDGSVYNTIDQTPNTANNKSSNHRIRCIIVINVVIVAALVAGLVTAVVVLLNKIKDDTTGKDASCDVLCGEYNDSMLNIKYKVSKGATTVNSSLDVTCEPGLVHANWSNTSVRCGAEGVWEGTPDCIMPEKCSIEFSVSEYVFTIGEEGSFRCIVSQYPNWHRVSIMKGDDETTRADPFYAYHALNGTTYLSYYTGTTYVLQDDGIIIDVKFNEVTCDVEGTYFGQLIAGDYADIRVANTSVYVRANSSTPKIIVPEKIMVTRLYVVECSGNVGRTNNRTFGRIALESRENGRGNFTTLDTGNNIPCDGAAVLTVLLTAERNFSSREFRCKIEDPAGNILYSEVVNRSLIDSFVSGDNITGYRLSSIGLPSGGLLEVNIPGFCDWGPVRYISLYNSRDPLDDLICQLYGYANESLIQPTSNSSYPEACMLISGCRTSNITTIFDLAKQCDVVYGPPTWQYGTIYKEINCVPAQVVDGVSKLQGRVEAGLFGQVKSICSLGFDARAADVLCASLGYKRGATQLWNDSFFGAGSRPIYKRNITCTGDELSLELCNHSDTDIPECDNGNVVGVECQGDIIKLEPLFATRPYEGIVKGYHGDLRYDIVGNVSSTTAQTLCAMLGYGRIGFTGLALIWKSLYYYKKYVNCSGTEKSISECVGDLEYCVERNHYNCETQSYTYGHVTLFCSDYKIKGLSLAPNGTLLMEINGVQWRSCADYFSTPTAQAACRIMGYSGDFIEVGRTASTIDVEMIGSLVCNENAIYVNGCDLKHQFSYLPYGIDSACTEYVTLKCSNT